MRTTRTWLGEKFSEGARQAWLAMERLGLGASGVQAKIVRRGGEPLASGVVEPLLYGDREMHSLHLAVQFEAVLGVDPHLWLKPPSRAFVPPAARHAARMSTRTGARKRIVRSAGAPR